MNCSNFDDVLDELADGTLTGATGQEAQAHARECTACAHELATYRRTIALVTPLPVNAFPETFFARQRAAIMARVAASRARAWEAPPLCLAATLVLTGVLAAIGTDPVGAAFGDLLGNLVRAAGSPAPDASLTLVPVYAALLLAAVALVLRSDDLELAPAMSRAPAREA